MSQDVFSFLHTLLGYELYCYIVCVINSDSVLITIQLSEFSFLKDKHSPDSKETLKQCWVNIRLCHWINVEVWRWPNVTLAPFFNVETTSGFDVESMLKPDVDSTLYFLILLTLKQCQILILKHCWAMVLIFHLFRTVAFY